MVSDPDGTYGERIVDLGLSESIERGILAGFEIDVLEIRDPAPVLGLAEDALRGRRLALLQTALLEHAAAKNIRTMMTFHQRVEEAKAFAVKLPETAAELYATEVSDQALADAAELPPSSIDAEFYQLERSRHVPADRVWADWLCGDHLVAERRDVLRQFAHGIDAAGNRVHRAFLASVRILGEGVDITGERGVEAVCFADTRGSQVEIVQNIGRALRPNPDGTTKTARIVVPVFLAPGEDPDDMVASASFAPLVAVLNGLRSHDERLVEQLASRALSRSRQERRVHVQRYADGRVVAVGETGGAGGNAEQEGRDGTQGAVESALLHFSTPRDPATIAAFLRTRVYRPESLVWLEGYQALRRWRRIHHHTGLYAVPYDTEVELGVTVFPLGRWVHQQRKALRAGELEEHRRTQLDDEGMVWEPGDEAWETKLALLRSYRRAHGHLAPRQNAQWGDTNPQRQGKGQGDSEGQVESAGAGAGGEGVSIGQLMANLRRTGGLGRNPARAKDRALQLAAIDPDWNCPWPLDWQRHHAILRELATDEPQGRLPELQPGVMVEGDDLGRWIQRQQRDWKQLSTEQQERLTALGIAPAQRPAAPRRDTGAGSGSGKASAAFTRGVAALAQYLEREGADKPVPRGHLEPIAVQGEGEAVPIRLGVWLSNTKARRDKLTDPQRAALAELGVEWA